MSLIVQKFGGTSVANVEDIFRVSKIITDTYKKGNDVVVVVSAQGDTTDKLIEQAKIINKNASEREKDMLLSAGEQMSIAVLAMAIEKLGFPVISLLGWQAGFYTDSDYGSARIENIKLDRIKKELKNKKIVIVAGFQGINSFEDITTFGRGGSDTSAVALACVLNANLCQIFTDVNGVYTADPRKVKNAKKLQEISYDKMLELSKLGSRVLNSRSIEMAKKNNIEIEVLSSFTNKPGTIVKNIVLTKNTLINGVTKDDNIAKVSFKGISNEPSLVFNIFSKLFSNDINIDTVTQYAKKDIIFTIDKDNLNKTIDIFQKHTKNIIDSNIIYDDTISKVSIVGDEMKIRSEIPLKMFEAIYESDIDIQMISTSDIKTSVLINKEYSDIAVSAIHDKFF